MSEYKGDIEEWKGIEGYEGVYQVSSFGRVESLDREIVYGDRIRGEYHSRKGVILKPTLSNGYPTVSLSGKTHTVHSLVAKTFIENLNDNDLVVNHIDYNKENNFYKNLEYISQGDNVRHNYVAGKANIGENQKDAKLDVDKVIAIRKLLEEGTLSQNRIAKLFEISPTTITDIKKGRKWKHVGKQVKEVEPILPVNMPNWIITDVRFPNEAQAIKDRGGVLIRVNRPLSLLYPKQWDRFIKYTSDKDGSFKQDEDEFKDYLLTGNKEEEALYYKLKHYSETALDNYKDWDYVIDNDGSITELIEKVKQVVCK